jgi:hypothetical protein
MLEANDTYYLYQRFSNGWICGEICSPPWWQNKFDDFFEFLDSRVQSIGGPI